MPDFVRLGGILLLMFNLCLQFAENEPVVNQTSEDSDFWYNGILQRAGVNGNPMVDNILTVLREKKAAELEPTKLPDMVLSFKYLSLGKIELFDGYLSGITSLTRTGDTGMDFKDKKIHAVARMGAGRLNLQYRAKVTFLNIGPTVKVNVGVNFADVYIDLILIKGKPVLDTLKLHELKGIIVKVTGLGVLNFLLNSITKLLTSHMENTIRSVVERVLKKTIPDILNELI